ncbi:response regulator transcription factor [Robiginitalea marina]|uniref:Response regulator transcription factor n=1 Tax=Robiginitalea marina TaxID=2954105 RepID=A0ABT1AW20_9FLAO|nr:response regulator transcription factor [Robiginitalea marina]MCO5723548.1 response regulator transcription factor [Robiginitalea marina]
MHSKRLLLAEDDQMLASLIKYRLEKGGYRVDLATDGREVKTYLGRQMPDLIISDIMMPYFSGIELVDYLRNTMKSKVPVIIISTAGNEANILNAFDLGADDFISKPLSPTELLVRIGKLFRNT